MSKDKVYNELINSTRWRRLRRAAIEHHPSCVVCERQGRLTPAVEVHHIQPVERGCNAAEKERLMFNPSNLMPLCHRCHVELHFRMGRSGKRLSEVQSNAELRGFIAKYLS